MWAAQPRLPSRRIACAIAANISVRDRDAERWTVEANSASQRTVVMFNGTAIDLHPERGGPRA
jgi:hypothetical protein